MNPLVTVILCNYNQDKWLQAAIDSVLSQTYQHFELILIDNGSFDSSRDICLDAAVKDCRINPRLYKYNDKLTLRLNEAISVSRGEFISILYADDYYLPNKLKRQVEEFATLDDSYGVVYSPGYRDLLIQPLSHKLVIDPSLSSSGYILKDMFDKHYSEGFINPISPLIRRECFDNDHFLESEFSGCEAIFMHLAMTWKFKYIPYLLTVMRNTGVNEGRLLRRNIDIAYSWCYSLLTDKRFPKEYREAAFLWWCRLCITFGWCALREIEDKELALRCFKDAIKHRKKFIFHPRLIIGYLLTFLPNRDLHYFNDMLNDFKSV